MKTGLIIAAAAMFLIAATTVGQEFAQGPGAAPPLQDTEPDAAPSHGNPFGAPPAYNPAELVRKTPDDIENALQKSDGITVMMGLRNLLLPVFENTDLSRLAETIFEVTKDDSQITLHFGPAGKGNSLLIATKQREAQPIVAAITKELFSSPDAMSFPAAAESDSDPLEPAERGLPDVPATAERRAALGTVAHSSQEYETLEREAAALAEQYRRRAGSPPKQTKGETAPAAGKPESTVPVGQVLLRDAVARAFESRQAMQRAEIERFRQRLDRIEQQIASREPIKDAIIDRRVEELLDPNVNWDLPKPISSQKTAASQRSISSVSTEPQQSAASQMVLGKTPEEFQELLVQGADQVRQMQNSIRRLKEKRAEGTDVEAEKNLLASLEQRLKDYSRKLTLAHQEYREQIKLLEAVLEREQTRLEVADEALRFSERLHEKGYSSSQDLQQAQLKKKDAGVAVQRAESLLKLYQQAGAGMVPSTEYERWPTSSAEPGDRRIKGGSVFAPTETAAGEASISVQLSLRSPQGATVLWNPRTAEGKADRSAEKTLPARFSASTGETATFSLYNIPDGDGIELFGSLETPPVGDAVSAFVAHNAIPVEITDEDMEQAASGNLVVKVVYLPEAQLAEKTSGSVETLVSTRLDPGLDPVAEAQRRGHVLATLRLGNRARSENAIQEYTPPRTSSSRPSPSTLRAYLFTPGSSLEHRQAVFEQLMKARPGLAANLSMVSDDYAILYYAKDNQERAEIETLVRRLDVKPSAAKPTSQWPLFRGDPQMTGVAGASLADDLSLLWSFRVKKGAFESTAAIVGGMAYIGDLDGKLHALDMNTGEKKWQFDTGETSAGFNSAPAVRDALLYIGDRNGTFHCLQADDGKPVWKFETKGEINSSPNFYNGNVLIGSQDATLYCLDANSGGLVWKHSIDDQIRSSPTIAGNHCLLAGCDGRLHIIDLDRGEKVADVPIDGPTGVTPAAHGDLVYFGTENGTFYAVDWKKAEVAWTWEKEANGQGIRSSPAVTDDLVLFGGRDKRLYALDPATGQEIWSFLTHGRVDSSPVVAGTRAYVGSDDGRVYGVELATGEKAWAYEAGGRFLGSPAVAADKLVIASDNGAVYCFGAKK